ITLDALDCSMKGQSNISKFAYAFSILMNELRGSIIGSAEHWSDTGITIADDLMAGIVKEEDIFNDEKANRPLYYDPLDSMFPSEVKTEKTESEDMEEQPLGLVDEPAVNVQGRPRKRAKRVYQPKPTPPIHRFPHGTLCPYCEWKVSSLRGFKRHVQFHHPDMLSSQALIYVCDACEFKSARAYETIDHWNESGDCREKGLRFDYAAAKKALRLWLAAKRK
ncbi:hypothetical protein PFISCL1PPCAC_4430, partial [Pristionchus fissidentatus]